jgi:hypothetical protein
MQISKSPIISGYDARPEFVKNITVINQSESSYYCLLCNHGKWSALYDLHHPFLWLNTSYVTNIQCTETYNVFIVLVCILFMLDYLLLEITTPLIVYIWRRHGGTCKFGFEFHLDMKHHFYNHVTTSSNYIFNVKRFIENVLRSTLSYPNDTSKECIQFLINYTIKISPKNILFLQETHLSNLKTVNELNDYFDMH